MLKKSKGCVWEGIEETDTPDGFDSFVAAGFMAELSPETAHMHIRAVVIGGGGKTEYLLRQLFTRHNSTGGPDQHLQKTELNGGQRPRLTTTACYTAAGVQFDIADYNAFGYGERGLPGVLIFRPP